MNTNRIPIVVGVTGHRDLREGDRPVLEEKVREILTELRTSYANSPLVVLSSLAEGSDQLVARVALDCGAQLMAPLPMPVDEYRKDFVSENVLREFSDLLGRAAASFVLPYELGTTSENISDEDRRAGQYAKVGHYTLRHCHILLALWDGDKTEKTGGTSQVVRQKLTGFLATETPEWSVLTPPDSGIVYQVVTPRESNPNPYEPFRLKKYYLNPQFHGEGEEGATALENAEKIFTSLLQRTDGFNRDVIRHEKDLAGEFQKSRATLEPDHYLGKQDENLMALLGPFAAADVLATFFQKKRRFSLAQVCFLALEAPVCLAAYHTADVQHPTQGLICLALFFLALGWAFYVYLKAKTHGYETRHLDYRALAEGMRVLYFWRLAGIHDDVGAQYLRKQRSEIDWIRLAVRAADLRTSLQASASPPYEWIETHWMGDQLHYFEKSGVHNGRFAERCELSARVAVKSGIAVAALMLATHTYIFYEHLALSEEWGRVLHNLSVVIVTLLATGGAITAYAEKMAVAQTSKQYGHMRRLFTLALMESRACLERGESDHVRAIIRRLGHEALRENGDWVVLHRERPMELKLG